MVNEETVEVFNTSGAFSVTSIQRIDPTSDGLLVVGILNGNQVVFTMPKASKIPSFRAGQRLELRVTDTRFTPKTTTKKRVKRAKS